MAITHSHPTTSNDSRLSSIPHDINADIAKFGIQNVVERAFMVKTFAGKKIITQILDARLKEFLEEEAAIKAIQAYLAQQQEQSAEQEEKQEAVESLAESVYQYKRSSDKNNDLGVLDKLFKEFIKELTHFYRDLEKEHKEELTEEEIPESTDIHNNLETLENLLKKLPLNVLKTIAMPSETTDGLTTSSPINEQKQLSRRIIANLTSKPNIVADSDAEDENIIEDENTIAILNSTQKIILALEQNYINRQRKIEERQAKWERALGKTLLYQHELDNYAAKYSQYEGVGEQLDIYRQHRNQFISQSQIYYSRTKHWENIANGTNKEKEIFSVALNRYSPLIEEIMKRYQKLSSNNNSASTTTAGAATLFGIKPGHPYKTSVTQNMQSTYTSPSPFHTKLGHHPKR